jgi:hypothetical protein
MKTGIVMLSDIVKNGMNLSAKDMLDYKEKQEKEKKNK